MIGCAGPGAMKDSDKFKLMLLAWNYHNQAQGKAKRIQFTRDNVRGILDKFCTVVVTSLAWK